MTNFLLAIGAFLILGILYGLVRYRQHRARLEQDERICRGYDHD